MQLPGGADLCEVLITAYAVKMKLPDGKTARRLVSGRRAVYWYLLWKNVFRNGTFNFLIPNIKFIFRLEIHIFKLEIRVLSLEIHVLRLKIEFYSCAVYVFVLLSALFMPAVT